jgi:hypothetical protein
MIVEAEAVKLKVIAFTIVERLPNNDHMYEHLAEQVDLHRVCLTKEQSKVFWVSLKEHDLSSYDRVLMDIPFKYLYRKRRKLKGIDGLAFLEEDSCQNFLPSSKWYKKFEKFYKSLPSCRPLLSGAVYTERFRVMGVDAHFVGKAYDETLFRDSDKERSIKLGFVGRVKSDVYSGRKDMLEEIATKTDLQLLRANPGQEYAELLQDIKFFVSADVGLGEYMIKNFEAMASGCVLMAKSQGEEDMKLGFSHMHNCILYDSPAEIGSIVEQLELDQYLCKKLVVEGGNLSKDYTYKSMANRVSNSLAKDFNSIKHGFWLSLLVCIN